jgi:hypothetical protein
LKGRDFAVAAIQDRHILAEYRAEVTREHRLTLANAGQAIASQFSQASCLDAFVEILPLERLARIGLLVRIPGQLIVAGFRKTQVSLRQLRGPHHHDVRSLRN